MAWLAAGVGLAVGEAVATAAALGDGVTSAVVAAGLAVDVPPPHPAAMRTAIAIEAPSPILGRRRSRSDWRRLLDAATVHPFWSADLAEA